MGGNGGQSTREYQERQVGNTREVREKTTKTAGGAGEPYTYREESNFVSSTSSSSVPERDPQPEELLQDMHPHTCPGLRKDVSVSCQTLASTDLPAWAEHQPSPDPTVQDQQTTACHSQPKPFLL